MATDSELAWIGFEAWWSGSALDRIQLEAAGQPVPKLFATTTKDLYSVGEDGKFHEKPLPQGSVVRVTMMSRFGDVGITSDLKARHGYDLRVMPHNGTLKNYRTKP